MNVDRFCPVHAPEKPTVLTAWGCPTSCRHLIDELDRRISEMTVSGNYFKLVNRRKGHRRRPLRLQEYRNHQPFGKPQTRRSYRRVKSERTPRLRRIRQLYRARRR